MLVRAPRVHAEEHRAVRIDDLTEVVVRRRRLGEAEQRLVPGEAARHVGDADDRPGALHRLSSGLTTRRDQWCICSVEIEPRRTRSLTPPFPRRKPGPKLTLPLTMG